MAATTGLLLNSKSLSALWRSGPSIFWPNSDISAPAMNALPAPFRIIPFISLSSLAFFIFSTRPTLTPLLNGFTGGLSTSRIAMLSTTE